MNYTQPMFSGIPAHAYSNAGAFSGPHFQHGGPGFCPGCCHPRAKCCCGLRECRKEAKELLVEADTSVDGKTDPNSMVLQRVRAMAMFTAPVEMSAGETTGRNAETKAAVAPIAGEVDVRGKAGIGKAFIGGGCCVHLSIEYTPTNAASTAPALVFVVVQDSEKTTLGWMKQANPQDGYQIKEGIITTKPGAHLTVLVVNMTARVRWCEVFSC